MEREARLLFFVGPNKKGNEQRTERKRDKDAHRQKAPRENKEQHPRSAFPLEGAILNPGSLFLVFSMCFTRVFFRNTRFVREWGQRHLKKSKKGPPKHPQNEPRTTPGPHIKHCRNLRINSCLLVCPRATKGYQKAYENQKKTLWGPTFHH